MSFFRELYELPALQQDCRVQARALAAPRPRWVLCHGKARHTSRAHRDDLQAGAARFEIRRRAGRLNAQHLPTALVWVARGMFYLMFGEDCCKSTKSAHGRAWNGYRACKMLIIPRKLSARRSSSQHAELHNADLLSVRLPSFVPAEGTLAPRM